MNETLNYVEGTEWNMFSLMMDDAGFTKELQVQPPNAVSLDQGFQSPWNAGPVEAGLGIVDVFLGSLFTLDFKLQWTRNSPSWGFCELSLIVPVNREVNAASFLEPFESVTWIFLFGMIA